MSLPFAEDQFSDEEVFFGKITLKEIKKHIKWNNHRINAKHSASDDYNEDIKIIEMHSTPDLNHKDNISSSIMRKAISNTSLSPDTPEVYSSWAIKPTDDSFLKVEQMVADMCVSPKTEKKNDEVLNNTLDIIDYILKNGPPTNKNDLTAKPNNSLSDIDKVPKKEVPQIELTNTTKLKDTHKTIMLVKKNESDVSVHCTPTKVDLKYSKKTDKNVTPYIDMKPRTPIFKTPGNPLSHKKILVASLKKTPSKNNIYQHIASPVASYIKNSPVAPLVKEVRPTKPLPGISSIPKFVKTNTSQFKSGNKENLNLPSVAYRSAKKTQVINVPDEDKLPQSQWIKKITPTLPKPLIMKHDHRETNLAKRILVSRQEDSFADLSLRQADVSVCTQKSAFNKKPL